MKVLGLNFTKVSAEKNSKLDKAQISTKIDFEEPRKEEAPLLKEQELYNFPFSFTINYNSEDLKSKKSESKADLLFKGIILVSGTKDEMKELLADWKSKDSKSQTKASIINLIMQKCTIKALSLEEDVLLPPHISLPKIAFSN